MLNLISPTLHPYITLGSIILYLLIFALTVLRSAIILDRLEYNITITESERKRLVTHHTHVIHFALPLLYLLIPIFFIVTILFVNVGSAFLIAGICVFIINFPCLI